MKELSQYCDEFLVHGVDDGGDQRLRNITDAQLDNLGVGRLLGKSPVRFRKARNATIRLSVKKRGYFSKKLTVGPNARSRSLSIRLKEIRIEMP